jgi:hypothetical protein
LGHKQLLNGSKEQVFPLLCPIREYDWIDDWSCILIHSNSGYAEPNCVFTTMDSDTRLGAVQEEVWIVSRYEPPSRIEFVKFAAEYYIVKYEIVLTQLNNDKVEAHWVQHLIGLTEAGNRAVNERKQEDYAAGIEAMEAKLNHYLLYGKCQGREQ